MKTSRVVLLVAGLLVAGWGVWKLAAYSLPDLEAVAFWLAGGVFAHDGLVVPVTLALGLGASVLPRWWRAPAAVGLIVFGSATLLAIPVLGRFGARDDNPSLLDRNYVLGWSILGLLTVALVALSGWRLRAIGLGGANDSGPPGDAEPLAPEDAAAARSTGRTSNT